MAKEIPLLDKIYKEPLYQDVCRWIRYGTKTYRELAEKLELLTQAYGKGKAEYAVNQLLSYDGQYTCNPKPLAEVKLWGDVRKLCFQLLGPSPEQESWFYANADGSPCGCVRPNREEPKSEPEKKPVAKKKPKGVAPKAAAKKPARKKQKA